MSIKDNPIPEEEWNNLFGPSIPKDINGNPVEEFERLPEILEGNQEEISFEEFFKPNPIVVMQLETEQLIQAIEDLLRD